MIPQTTELVAELEARFTDPDQRVLLAKFAADATAIAATALTDPARAATEAKFLKASISNFTAAEQHVISGMVSSFVMRVVFTALAA